MKINVRPYWDKLLLREKRIVAGGALALFILLCYALIWSPLSSSVDALREHIETNKELLSWMKNADLRIQSLEESAQPRIISSKSILSAIQNELPASGFADHVSALRQADAHSVQLNLQAIPFDNLIIWLTQLAKTRGLQVIQMTVTPSATQGIVTAEIVLQ